MGSWSIRLRVVLVVAAGVVVALAATILIALSGFRSEATAASKNALAESRAHFVQLKTRDTAMLSAVLDSLIGREDLKRALAARDRPRLEALCAPVFVELRATCGITHLTSIAPDGRILLRAHQPSAYGDLIVRKSLEMARVTGGYGTGLELGKTAYALRVAHSVVLSDEASEAVSPRGRGSLIGYMEAGEEIGHFLRLMRSQASGDEYALLIPKSALTHRDWAALRAEQCLPDDWDPLPDWVAAGSTEPSLAVGLSLPAT